jgi:transcriptional regulator of nitric oxide reductase
MCYKGILGQQVPQAHKELRAHKAPLALQDHKELLVQLGLKETQVLLAHKELLAHKDRRATEAAHGLAGQTPQQGATLALLLMVITILRQIRTRFGNEQMADGLKSLT